MLKEKTGKFMEGKECNAKGKTSACQKPSFISAMSYYIFTKKLYVSNVIILKNEEICPNFFFFRKLKKYF
jgi:hypothetical protein